jgi:hypothetical protein
MTANLFGERYAGRKAGWHELGTVFTEPTDAIQAVEIARLNYGIELRPLLVDIGGVMVAYDRKAIVRMPTPDDAQYRVLGTAAADYGLLQNTDLARLINPLTDKWPVETVGALGMGETVFFCLDAGEDAVKGDPVHKYFVCHDTRDGETALGLMFTPIRTQCQNTLDAGKFAAIASAILRHSPTMEREFEWRIALLGEMQKAETRVMGQFDALAECFLSEAAVKHIVDIAYPYPRKPRKVELAAALDVQEFSKLNGLMETVRVSERDWATAKERIDERRAAVATMFGMFNDDNPTLSGTAWGLYNAVVEVEDFREPMGNEDANLSMLFGERGRTKQRAFGAAWEWSQGKVPEMAVLAR